MRKLLFLLGLLCIGLASAALNPTVTISQSGADDGTVIFGREFTVTLTVDESANEATLSFGDYDNAFSVVENRTRTMSGTSVSWTVTPVIDVNGVQASVRVTASSSGSTGVSSVFDVVTPPSIDVTVSPSSLSVDPDGVYVITARVHNSGETTLRDVIASINLGSTGMSLSSGVSQSHSLGDISGGAGGTGGVKTTSWVINAGSTPSSGSITVTVTSFNADSKSVVIPVTSSYSPSPSSSSNPSSSGSVIYVSSSSNNGFVTNLTLIHPSIIHGMANNSFIFNVSLINYGSDLSNVTVNFTSPLDSVVSPGFFSVINGSSSVSSFITINSDRAGLFTGNVSVYFNDSVIVSGLVTINVSSIVVNDSIVNKSLISGGVVMNNSFNDNGSSELSDEGNGVNPIIISVIVIIALLVLINFGRILRLIGL